MSKPDDVSQEDWDAAVALPIVSENFDDLDLAIVAQAIAAARDEGRAEAEFAHDMLLLADRFKVGEENGHPVWVVSRGPNSWAIWDGAFVLNSDGEWECEPLPSNRDEDFISRTRWAFSDAMARALASLPTAGDGKGGVE